MKSSDKISIADRLKYGSLGLQEIAALKGVCIAVVRDDARRGALRTFKHGRRRLAKGPDVARYLQSEAAP